MLGLGWLTLRQAQEALKSGRLEDAQRLLQQPDLAGHKGSWELLQQVAAGFVERGERQLKRGDLAAAWHDLLLAEQAGAPEQASGRLRQALVQRGLQDAHAFLDAGDPARAAEALARMGGRAGHHPDIHLLHDLAKGWVAAQELAERGEFAHAIQTVERVRRLQAPPPVALVKFHQELTERGRKCSELLVKLHEAADGRRWREALLLAEQVLALAPHQAEARKVRAQAWKSVEPATAAAAVQPIEPPAPRDSRPVEKAGERFLLWIDGVGGYLVCLGNRVTLGQATPEARVDVPLFADVSRLHGAMTRDAEGYLLEGVRAVRVNGRLTDRALLQPGDRLTLGSCCMLSFSQPVPVSATAQLELVSGHRLPLALDKVFLMADTLVLGPGPQAHVIIPDLRQPVVLFRQKDGLGVRYGGDFVVDGEVHRDRATLGPGSRVSGEGFAFAVEKVGARLG